MVKLISAILSLTMLFGTGAAPASTQVTANVPVTVGKQQAVYEKYECLTENTNKIETTVSNGSFITHLYSGDGEVTYVGYKGHNGVSDEGNIIWGERQKVMILSYESGGSYLPVYIDLGYLEYNKKGYYINSYSITHSNPNVIKWTYTGIIQVIKSQEEVKGTYLADVTAVVNSLPTDGKHTDGFWYVFKNLVED